ncbi:hypothetical protein [Pseudomonas putida]|uniref:hypothetical protein n=1 Tax=Pseudomonas putida TaxID=303 RepID=UPI000818FFE2|nr:hypothetical protein [Pseudomonas putida]OCT29487.1 hypothetical protein A6E20_03475 [Pseudomonas putida]OCT31183.1 hypothetical protein A6E23_01230 [Pseudomonas putida]OCT33425.1 hypothetical protein A6E24_00415 [Pseudomonas putida]OCT39871.1 hypothetical protein A6E19_00420 [Pseudomonas putida]
MGTIDIFSVGRSPSAHSARERLETLINLSKLFASLDQDPTLIGVGVVYIDANYNIIPLRKFRSLCSIVPRWLVLHEMRVVTTAESYAEQVQQDTRISQVFSEAANAGLACAGAVISAFVFVFGGAMTPFSAGTSTVLFYVGLAGTIAGGAQCLVGVGRTVLEVIDPAGKDALNDDFWFRITSQLLDAVSLLAVIGAPFNAIRYFQIRKSATGLPWHALTRAMSRQQRRALTVELLRVRHPSLTAKQIKLAQRNNEMRKRYSSLEVNHATRTMVYESIAGALSVGGSGTVQSIVASLVQVEKE